MPITGKDGMEYKCLFSCNSILSNLVDAFLTGLLSVVCNGHAASLQNKHRLHFLVVYTAISSSFSGLSIILPSRFQRASCVATEQFCCHRHLPYVSFDAKA